MINFLKQLIELIRNVTNYAMKNKVFRYLYKAFLFISSLYIVKMFSIFWRYTRKIWSLLSALLLLVIADFNFSNIITAFSLILSSLPSYINNGIVNLWKYINNIFSDKHIKNVPPISPPINREKITDIITDDKIEYEPFPGRFYRRTYNTENHNFGSETFLENYGYYIFGSVVIIIIIGGTYYYYGDDIKTYINKYLPGLFKNSNDSDRGSGSEPQADGLPLNEVDENLLPDISDDSDSDSEVEATFAEVSRYFRTPVDNSKENTPLPVDKSVQTKTPPNINTSVQTDSSSNIDSSVQTEGSSNIDSSVQTDILPNIDSSVQTEGSSNIDSSVQTDILPNINSSVQTDSSSNIDSSVQTDSSLKGDNILDDKTKNEILQLFSRISPENLEDIEDTFNPENTPAASEIPETSLVKNTPAFKKSVQFIDGHEERIFTATTEELESKKKGYRFWLEAKSVVSQASDSDYSPSPISPLEESPFRGILSSYQGRFGNIDLFNRFSEIILEDQSPEELLKATNEFNQLNTEKFVDDWLEAKSKNISAIDFLKSKTSIIYPITKKLLLNVLENA